MKTTIEVDGTLGERPVKPDATDTKYSGPQGKIQYLADLVKYLGKLSVYAFYPYIISRNLLSQQVHESGAGFSVFGEGILPHIKYEGTTDNTRAADFVTISSGTSFLRYDGIYNTRVQTFREENNKVSVDLAYGRYNYEGYANALYYCYTDSDSQVKNVFIDPLSAATDGNDADLAGIGIDQVGNVNFSLIDGMVIDVLFSHRQNYGADNQNSTECIYLDVCNTGRKSIEGTENRNGVNAWLENEVVKFRYSSTFDCWLIVSRSMPGKEIILSESGTDLDGILAPGTYIIESNALAGTFSNMPVSYAGYLETFKLGSTMYLLQRFTPYNNSGMYTRWYNCYNNAGWVAWKKYSATNV